MPINPNQPFSRQYVDLPTPLALKMEKVAQEMGKSKKSFVCDAIEAAIAQIEQAQASKKGSKKS